MLSFHIKSSFVLEKFTILYWLFGYVEKRLVKKAKINFKICNVADWTTNNYNTRIVQKTLYEVKAIYQHLSFNIFW